MATPSSGPSTTAPPPSGDRRMKLLDAALRRAQYQPAALLEVLHAAQGAFGFLADDVLAHVARALKLPPSRVYGVATFYNLFSLKPKGEHVCTVCLGTACYVKGADALLAAVGRAHGVEPGGTTADGRLSLAVARCIGACGAAPAVVLDGEIRGGLGADELVARTRAWTKR